MLTINPIQSSNYQRIQLKDRKQNTNKTAVVIHPEQKSLNLNFMGGYMPIGLQRVAQKAKTKNLSFFIDSLSGVPENVSRATSVFENAVLPYVKRKQRGDKNIDFSHEQIEKIANNVTGKNLQILHEVLGFKDNVFDADEVVSLLQYVDKKETNVDEFREKMGTLRNLEGVIKGLKHGVKKSILPDYFEYIPSSSLVDLLKSDVLLEEPKFNYNSLPESYNNVVKYYEHQISKKDEVTGAKKDPVFVAKTIMKESFSDMLILGMVFDRSTTNELFYNRGLYVKPNYMPRFKMLNEEDLKLLRNAQISAVTEKENKGGDLSVYEISLNDKISMLNLLAANREIINSGNKGLNFQDYIQPVDLGHHSGNFKIRFQDLKRDLTYAALRRIGVDPKRIEKYIEEYDKAIAEDPDLRRHRDKVWDINYCHLLNAPKDSLLRKIVKTETNSNFKDWIFKEGFVDSPIPPLGKYDSEGIDYVEELYAKGILDRKKDSFMPFMKDRINSVIGLYRKNLLDPNNRDQRFLFNDKAFDYIQTLHKLQMLSVMNEINRRDFEKNGINFEKWLNPTIDAKKCDFTSRDGRRVKEFTVKNWKRNPMESLFDGNYTTCCTGIDKDQGASFLSFMTNACTTTLEVRTEKNKVVAMSRVLMAKINGKLSMVVENIEVNNKIAKHYLYDDESKYKFREMIFDYARDFAKHINKTNEEIPVYFCGRYYKVTDIAKGLKPAKKETDVEVLGVFENNFYINSYGSQWDMLRIRDDGDELFLDVADITEKTEKPVENVVDKESDSNYNYGDRRDYK